MSALPARGANIQMSKLPSKFDRTKLDAITHAKCMNPHYGYRRLGSLLRYQGTKITDYMVRRYLPSILLIR